MRYLPNSVVCRGLALALAIGPWSMNARAKVYATNIKLNGSTNDASLAPGQALTIGYILNEPASRGVTIRILSGATPVRTISITGGSAGTVRGTNTVTWDGKTDGGTNAASGAYTFSITAAATGYSGWTQTTSDTNAGNQVYQPWGLAVNQNPNSFYYGRVFVANTFDPNSGQSTNSADRLGFQKLNADASPADEGIFSDGGYPWVGNFSPFRLRVGADDRFYAEDWANSGGLVMSWDQPITTNSILYVTRDDNNPGGSFTSFYVSGTGTNRQMWMTDSLEGGTGFGVNLWNVQTNGVLATSDLGISAVPITTGTNGLDDSAYDVSLDANGRIYVVCQPSFDTQNKIMRFPAYTGTSLTNADWRADTNSPVNNGFAIAVTPPGTLVAVGRITSRDVLVLDASTGSTVTNIPADAVDQNGAHGGGCHAVAWDNVGNLYLAFDAPPAIAESVWQAWSPPGTNQATTAGLETIHLVGPIQITSIVPSGTNFVITFNGSASDPPSAYTVLSGPAVTGITNVAAATITGSGGVFQATVPASGAKQFYRIRR